MSQGIDLTAVYMTDYVGVLLLTLILFARGWELPGRRRESRILFSLTIATLIDCLIDPIVFEVDGRPGFAARMVVIGGNSLIYMYNLVVGSGMVTLVVRHIRSRISRFQLMTVVVLSVIEAVLLVINVFYPVVFSVDENNVYKRAPLYFVYIAVAFYLIAYSLFVYIKAGRNGSLRYFPVWGFCIPIVFGVTLQTMFYGISAQPVSFAVAFTCIVICLQRESLYIDKLTGVYNRYEFDKIVRYYRKRKKQKFAAVMIDMNGFKSINDNYSHREGDEALQNMAKLLTDIAGDDGNVIRFAGDEFIMIMDYQGDDTVENCCAAIRDALDGYNAASDKPYTLSASMGGASFDVDEGVDVIGRIDSLMYDDKVRYYKTHDRRTVMD